MTPTVSLPDKNHHVEVQACVSIDKADNVKISGWLYCIGKDPWKKWKKHYFVLVQVLVGQGTVRPHLSGPLLSGSLAIRKKIIGYRFTAHVMHTYSMCVRLSDSLAYPDIFVENGHVQLSEV